METVTLTAEQLKKLMTEAGAKALELDFKIQQRIVSNPDQKVECLIHDAITEVVGSHMADKVFANLKVQSKQFN